MERFSEQVNVLFDFVQGQQSKRENSLILSLHNLYIT